MCVASEHHRKTVTRDRQKQWGRCFTSVTVGRGSWVTFILLSSLTAWVSKSQHLSLTLSPLLPSAEVSSERSRHKEKASITFLYVQSLSYLMQPEIEQKTIQSASWDPTLSHSCDSAIFGLKSAEICRKGLSEKRIQRWIQLLLLPEWIHLGQMQVGTGKLNIMLVEREIISQESILLKRPQFNINTKLMSTLIRKRIPLTSGWNWNKINLELFSGNRLSRLIRHSQK